MVAIILLDVSEEETNKVKENAVALIITVSNYYTKKYNNYYYPQAQCILSNNPLNFSSRGLFDNIHFSTINGFFHNEMI